MRLIDAEALENEAVEFPNTSIWVPIEKVWEAPTIDAEPVRRSRWVFNPRWYEWECGRCGHGVEIGGRTKADFHAIFRYCPHCGALMEEKVDKWI